MGGWVKVIPKGSFLHKNGDSGIIISAEINVFIGDKLLIVLFQKINSMTVESTDSIESKLFSADNLSAREQVTNWIKLKEKLGTRVAGIFLGFWEKPAEGVYRRQVSMALRDFKDSAVIYGVTLPDYFEKDLMRYRSGDQVGAEYYKDIPAKEAGVSATKAVRLFNLDLKEREKNGTAQGVVTPSTPKVEEADNDLDF